MGGGGGYYYDYYTLMRTDINDSPYRMTCFLPLLIVFFCKFQKEFSFKWDSQRDGELEREREGSLWKGVVVLITIQTHTKDKDFH